MSDVIPTQHESAVAILRERERELDIEIAGYTDSLRLANAQREVLLDMIARLTRVPRARKPRMVVEAAPANDQPEETSPRPTVFATPSLVEADAA
jgi:hypothetical protein